jgi:hypothetical protein
MERTDRSVDDVLAGLPDDVRNDMIALDGIISRVMDGSERELYEGTFWGGSEQEIIGYGRMSQRRSDNEIATWFRIGLAVQKRYLSVYVSAVENGQYIAETYGPSVGAARVGKSVISFSSLGDIDEDALIALLEKARDTMEDS